MEPLTQFADQRFMALETFLKTGTGVRTPVGFVQEGDTLLVRTPANSGKVKRIRNNSRVRIVPSDGRGTPAGEWVDATATILDAAASQRLRPQLRAKYGVTWSIIETVASLRHRLSGKGRQEWLTLQVRL